MPDSGTAQFREVVANWLEEARVFGELDPQGYKRAHPRYAWNRPMELLMDGKTQYVYSRDISESGIGLVCRHRLHEGMHVGIRRDANDPWIPTSVAHCTQTVGAFKIGAELVFEF